MRLDFSNFWQIQTLGYAVVVGVLLCLSYDAVRFFYKLIKPNTFVVALVDVLYWIYAAVVSFCFFMLFSKGVIRLYAYFGFFVGFALCRITLSKLFMIALEWAQKLIKFITFWLNKPVSIIIEFLQKNTAKISKTIHKLKNPLKILKIFKKIDKKL